MEDFSKPATKEDLQAANEFADAIMKNLENMEDFQKFLISESLSYKIIQGHFGNVCASVYLEAKSIGMKHFAWMGNISDQARAGLEKFAPDPPDSIMQIVNKGVAKALNQVVDSLHNDMVINIEEVVGDMKNFANKIFN